MGINLGIAHLRAVVALADHASFTAAANWLQVSQPNLSRTVAEAERRLGVRLFMRTTRSVDLTGDGHEVTAYARRVLLEFDDGLEQIGRFVSGDRGTVTIACLPSIAATFLPPYIVDFRSSHPDVSVHIRDGLRDDVVASVRDGSVDFAVVAASGRANDLVRLTVSTDAFVCALPPNHALAQRTSLLWTDLADQPFVAFGPESSIASHVQLGLESAGVDVGPSVQAHNVAAVAGMTAAGLGITVIPELVVPMMSFANLVYLPIEPTIHRTISVVQLPGRRQSASCTAFLDILVPALNE
ncbi:MULTISPECIES: LysR family transcriptional regulator [unclassified Rhodococcus (in: high G+C Gram-positive bacteria)]|uniref:LysR family transcriptional regulator n=1 Tax=unclassified Rhodococcus (in: high G+C Gram-positive bacteria) TaxID=192944 RepID=UPI000B9A3157|nr:MULTISPECIES: LysR family transcriptional regulator [unclassified Rhodococcus (in: high G+C Gram-positive bacteria)]OZE36262.1 LysR family transcriptional regulator [Rhodococcus sp. 05-2254-4]OZE41350.1 LysR family transcriptional regulator [Rhodococcus sp. 05-2254-3]OZE44697.1 LysR family transcriptional regulator [Rhodococcus sp. 05-2254-2]